MRYLKLIFLIFGSTVSTNVQSETVRSNFTNKSFEHQQFPDLILEGVHNLNTTKSSRPLERCFDHKQYIWKDFRCREAHIFDSSNYVSSFKNLNEKRGVK